MRLDGRVISLILGATAVAGAATDSAVVRLADVQQCPASPKPTCSDENCQGSIYICATQFRCGSERPFSDPGDPVRQVVLAGCRCCPLPIHVVCDNYNCRAPEGTRTCALEELQGCSCQTWEDRRAAVAQEPILYWDIGEEDLIDICPDYPSDEETTTTATTMTATSPRHSAMSTMQPFWLLSLRHEWDMAKLVGH